jgi:PAS domain S-box-containing protein
MSSNQVRDKFPIERLPDSGNTPPTDTLFELTRLQDKEKILLEELSLYKLANRVARLGLWIVELPEKRIIWSDEACLIHEIPIGSIPTLEQAINFYAPESRPKIQEVVESCINKGTPFNEELQLITAKGTRLIVHSIGEAIRNDAGEISKIQVVLQDISDINRTEANLRASNEKLRGLYELSPMGILLCDMQGHFVEFNEAFCRICGYTSDELSKLDYWTLTPKEYTDKEAEALDSLAKKGSYGPYIKEYIRKDGSRVPLQLNGVLIQGNDGQSYIWSIIENITERKLAEEQLQAASLYARSLIEASLDPLVTISPEGKITDVNKATEDVTGSIRSELIGTDFSDYFTEPEKAREGYQRAFLKKYVTDYPLVLRHRDGHITEVLYNASVYHNEAGDVLGVFAAARDVTERNKAEQEVAQLSLQNRLILDSAGEGIYGLDIDGKCTFVNPAALQLLGFRIEELIGQHSHSMFHHTKPDGKPYPQEDCPVQSAYKQGAVHRGSDLYWHKDGSSFPVEFISTPILEAGKITGAVVAFRDITELKKAENKITELNLDLERRVVERTEQLEAANKELEAFSYSVSHDLRTPLRAIDGFSHILLDDYAGKMDDEGKRLLNVVRDNASRMGRLIDDILKFSRTSRLEMTFTEIDMEKLAHEVVEELQPADGKLQVEIEPIPPATVDRAMMRQVFVNLLSNAIKFSSSRESARIKVGGSIEGDEAVYFVRDNGAGFDMQYADKLFGVFQRLHAMNEFEGTGIGLAIVKRIITRHGGRVWAEGKVNEGATIYFVVPNKEKSHE